MSSTPRRIADPRSRVRRLRRRVLGHRRALAALCAAIAMVGLIRTLSPAPLHEEAVPQRPASLGVGLAAAHPDLTPLPVRLPDAGMADLLEPGDRLSLLATDATGAATGAGGASATVARDVVVLSLPRAAEPGAGAGVTGTGGRLVVLGVRPEEADAVAAAAIRAVLTFSWDR